MEVFSQNAELLLKGKVTNENGFALPDVQVWIKGESKKVDFTNENGQFEILCVEGKHILVLSHISFKPFEKDILIDKNTENNYEIVLQEKSVDLQSISIFGKKKISTVVTTEALNYKHQQIAGGTSIAIMSLKKQRLETLKDALKYEPGVVIQEFFGANDQPRLSIRGSGIQSNPQRRGVYFLQDGIPVNFADGSFIIGVMDPSISATIEVLKGANAFNYGAATLGGAVNFNSYTGRFSPEVLLKAEGGSYGYGSSSVLMGNHWNKTDAFLSVSASRQDGFRQHNKNQKLNVSGNIGYRISDKIDNRTYINFSHIHFEIPGPLTLAMLKENPAQVNNGISLPYYMGPNIERDKPSREATVMRIANRIVFQLSSKTDVSSSVYYQRIKDRFVFPIVLSTQRSIGDDLGFNIHGKYRTNKGALKFGFTTSYGNIKRNGHINLNGLDSFMFSKNVLNALNVSLFAAYNHYVNDNFKIIGALELGYNQRNSKDVFSNPELRPWYSHTSHQYRYFHSESISLNQQFSAINPRLGFVYNTGRNKYFQFFGNLSGSYEPPTFDELIGSKVSNNINTSPKELFAIKLQKQSAFTAELGTRHQSKNLGWNFSIYHSWIKNELLEVKDFVLGEKKTENYPKTIHQGIELGFNAIVFKGLLAAQKKDMLVLKSMYTYSNFYFNSNKYKGNKLAGVPPHYITAVLEYNYENKFSVGLNTESQPLVSFVDHANTLKQPSLTIYGFRVGYEGWKNCSFYIEGKNILNKYYASSYVISDQVIVPPMPFPEFSANNLALFNPGATRAFYFGLTYTLDKKEQNIKDI